MAEQESGESVSLSNERSAQPSKNETTMQQPSSQEMSSSLHSDSVENEKETTVAGEAIPSSSNPKSDSSLNVLVEKTRRIMFTDAAVAIALTLLILPLMEASVDAKGEELTTSEWLHENADLFTSFILSYFVVAIAWVDHDRLFASVRNFTRLLSGLNFLWLWTIAFLPAATNIMNGVKDDAYQHILWIGTVLGAKILICLMTIVVHRNPQTWEDDGPSFVLLLRYLISVGLLITALLLSMVPPAGYWMMLLLTLRMPIMWLILWRWPNLHTKWTPSDNRVPSQTSTNGTGENNTSRATRECLMQKGFNFLVEAERRIMFIDAAAAIALTLLVVPIMDAATETREESLSTIEWFQENRDLMFSFFVSYFVICMCWNHQDRLVRRVDYFTKVLSDLNFLWLLAVVFIPVATSLINSTKDTMFQHVFYIGMPFIASFWTFLMTIEVHRNPNTWQDAESGPEFPILLSDMVLLVLFIVAMVVSLTSAGYFSLLVLILKTPITSLILWLHPSLKTRW